MFSFDDIIGRATGAADYLELTRQYEAFVITGVPGMNFRSRDLARRFITFIDAVYESRVSEGGYERREQNVLLTKRC